MEKKKNSKNYIIPAKFFSHIQVEEKIDAPTKAAPQVAEKKETYKKPLTQTPIVPEIEASNITGGRRRGASNLSLKSVQLKKEILETEVEVIDYSILPKTEFTEVQLLSAWKQYITNLREKGKRDIASIIDADTPRVEEFKIFITLPNSMMESKLKTHKPKLLKFLRDKLNNYSIDLEIDVNEVVEKKFAYTPLERYEKLKEKNPMLEDFRKMFGLDL